MLHANQILYMVVVALTCGITIWAGGRDERIGLAIVVVASLSSYPVTAFVPSRWHHAMPGQEAIDAATAIAFFIVMVRSKAFWPIWSFGFCAAMMMAHAMRTIRTALPAWSYYDTTSLWAYPVIVSILFGIARRTMMQVADA